jgi:hypothetical protein
VEHGDPSADVQEAAERVVSGSTGLFDENVEAPVCISDDAEQKRARPEIRDFGVLRSVTLPRLGSAEGEAEHESSFRRTSETSAKERLKVKHRNTLSDIGRTLSRLNLFSRGRKGSIDRRGRVSSEGRQQQQQQQQQQQYQHKNDHSLIAMRSFPSERAGIQTMDERSAAKEVQPPSARLSLNQGASVAQRSPP